MSLGAPVLRIVSTTDRPDLVEISARWRWEAFSRVQGRAFEDVLQEAQATAAHPGLMPHTFVLLVDGEPVGTASLVESDLEERPELTPWLAGVVVAEPARGHGYAAHLVRAVEQRAAAAGIGTLWLYTRRAERVYLRAGWHTVEPKQPDGKDYAVMRRDLTPTS